MATSTRLFQGRVVEDSAEKKESLCCLQLQSLYCLLFWVEHHLLRGVCASS